MTYVGLREVDATGFAAMAADFRLAAGRLRDRADVLAQSGERLGQHWTGSAARAAVERGIGLHRRMVEASTVAFRCDQVLAELADQLDRAKAMLVDAERLAATAGVAIDTAGRASLAVIAVGPDLGTVSVCAEVDRRIEAALRLADESDRFAADALRSLRDTARLGVPGLAGTEGLGEAAGLSGAAVPAGLETGPGLAGVELPSPDATPAQVAAYWAGLTAEQRWWLATYRPAELGALDGIPVADRDTANRLVLASERDRLLALRTSTSDPLPLIEIADLDGRLRGLDAIDSRLRDPVLARAYLLELSTVDDGRAVVAVGNPDRATDVLTCIPGAGADLSRMDGLLARADVLRQDAVRFAPQHQVSVITWLGYDPPDGLAAVSAAAAHDAEPALDDFEDGLRATHDPGGSHNTVLGHSYGSLVAGVTARDRGLAADDVIFIGSPGVGVDRATELGLPEGGVWSSTAANDPIQRYAPGWDQLAMDAAANAVRPFTAWYGDGTPDLMLWHGLNPSTPSFGGHVFGSDPDGGHNGYWQGTALDAITRVTVGLDPPPG